MTESTPRVKGFAFETTLREVSRVRGPEASYQVLRTIGGEPAAILERSLVAAGWYPIA